MVNWNWSYSPEMLNSGKIGDFLSRVTLKFDGWYWKIIGHLFYTTLNFVQHFQAIGIFKLEVQSGNAQFGSKLAIFWPGWLWNPLVSNLSYNMETPKSGKNWRSFCPVWPWKLTYDLKKIGHLSYTVSTFVHHFIANGEFKLELQSGNAQFGSKSKNLF